MGIERFFSSIEENNITNLENNFTYKLNKKVDTDIFLIDFNSIIHVTSSVVVSDLNYILYQIINKSYKNNKVIGLFKTYDIQLELNDELSYQGFLKLFDIDTLNNLILDKVKEFLINMLNNFIVKNDLKCLYLAIDGVPNKSKMLEQKKRRYMGAIINELKNKIFKEHETDLMANNINRYLYEKHKLVWSKIYISPGTQFMNNLNTLLSSKNFIKEIKSICPKLTDYIVSSSDEFGEGEKKIIDYSYTNNKYNNVTIYSPDSDMTLLCLILNDKVKNIKILRHNQQANNYDLVDIDLLKKNIFNYVSNSIKITKQEKERDNNINLNLTSVINDIVFVLTIFGNDFLPKIESFNVKYDFDTIIDKYITMLLNSNFNYIINKNTINQKMFTEMIRILHLDEGGNLQKTYMASHYQNYDKLKKIMGTTQSDFTKDMISFLEKLKLLNDQIKNNNININKWIIDDKLFISKLMKLTKLQLNYNSQPGSHEFLDNYIKYYKKNNRLPEVAIILKKYSKSLKNPHHASKLEKVVQNIDSNLKINKYDEEIYKLDNMLDEYTNKLNAQSLDLGYVSVDPKTYIWKSENIEKGVKRYYQEFFDVSDISIKNPKMKQIIAEYIEGMMWVFDYYFNIKLTNNKIDNKPDIWFYKYSHAPLLRQIYYFLKDQKDNYLNDVLKNLNRYKVMLNEFFRPEEHLMYVSPINLYPEIIPKKYKNKKINVINMKEIVDEIWNNDISHEIDCRGIIFLNKCHLNKIHADPDIFASWENDKKFIKILRA